MKQGLRIAKHVPRRGRAAREGSSLEETQATAGLQSDVGYEPISIPFLVKLDRESVIRRAWEEATGAVRPAQIPQSGGGA